MKKKKDEISFDGVEDYKEYLHKRSLYMQKYYKNKAEKSWKYKKGNRDLYKTGVSYAVPSEFKHN